MPTLVSECAQVERELWTDEDFLDWLQPGVHADLIGGEKAMHSQAHRFFGREGELLVGFLPDADGWIHSRVLAGFTVRVADLGG